MSFIAAFVVLTVVHTIALSSSLYRFHHRFTHNIEYGLDDVFATIATIGDLFMLGVFTSTVKEGFIPPFQYRLTLATYFFMVWMSRATLVMTPVRICLQSAPLRKKAIFFMSFTFGLVIAAIVYTAVSVLFCKSDTASCTNFKLCFCRLPLEIAVSAAIADFIVDTCAIYTSRALIYGDKDNDPPNSSRDFSRKRFLMTGFSSSLLTLMINLAFWTIYFFAKPGNYFLYLSMANAVSAICVLTFNIPLIAGILLGVVYPPSPDFISHLNITLTEFSDHTVADFVSPNEPISRM